MIRLEKFLLSMENNNHIEIDRLQNLIKEYHRQQEIRENLENDYSHTYIVKYGETYIRIFYVYHIKYFIFKRRFVYAKI